MTIEELYASLPEELRIRPGDVPPEIREAFTYLSECDALRDAGRPVPTIEEWRSRGRQ